MQAYVDKDTEMARELVVFLDTFLLLTTSLESRAMHGASGLSNATKNECEANAVAFLRAKAPFMHDPAALYNKYTSAGKPLNKLISKLVSRVRDFF